ncbi:MAG TPA: potassium/proton antiporter [Thermoanaerobaculia bacterium]|jgi:cell volume regulation protein A|nr:potassium/proton antiporter [Thermoanaerobaculia bacterium]
MPPPLLPSEPHATAWFLVVLGLLLAVSALFSRVSARAGIPLFLGFLALGMLAGSEGVGGIEFEDYGFAFRLGTAALVLILFDGGLNTPLSALRAGLRPAAALATVGVAGTASLVALGARLLGFDWGPAFLLGAVVSSTDAAAVFSVLRGSGLQVRQRVGTTLELESGLNDPMAVILTMSLTRSLAGGHPMGPGILPGILLEVLLQLIVGTAFGVAAGLAGRALLRRGRLQAGGLYPVLTFALALLAFGLPTLLEGSGFLAVYLAGVILGHGEVPYRAGVRHFHDAAAWCGQLTMFLVMGLLVFPSHLLEVAGVGLALALILAFVARPLIVLLCLLPLRFPFREAAFVSWVGLRGAVPIILATFPVLERVPGAERLFDVVFFVVVASALVPGGTVSWLARRLGLAADVPPPAQAVLEISSTQVLDGDVLSFHVDEALPVCGASLADIPLPPNAAVMLVVRGSELLAARGGTVLQPGDHVHLFCRREDRPVVELLFGRAGEV